MKNNANKRNIVFDFLIEMGLENADEERKLEFNILKSQRNSQKLRFQINDKLLCTPDQDINKKKEYYDLCSEFYEKLKTFSESVLTDE